MYFKTKIDEKISKGKTKYLFTIGGFMDMENKIKDFINTTLKKYMRIFTKQDDVYIFEAINFRESLEPQFTCYSFNGLHQSDFKIPNTPPDIFLIYDDIDWEKTIMNN